MVEQPHRELMTSPFKRATEGLLHSAMGRTVFTFSLWNCNFLDEKLVSAGRQLASALITHQMNFFSSAELS